ncbi:MAG: HDOD domain-containing protein [Candidatus Sericytochromatia bacterium]|nr:HDOD domain-containing protein [Candidatus Sericytochromatia bacterium]
MADVFVGRQPIFDRNLDVVGYELLYRSGENNYAAFQDADHATSVVLSNTFLEMGLEQLVGDKLAFINLTRAFLTGQYPLPLQPQRLVLEVLEDITIDDELVAGLQALSAQGFQLALDDVVNPQQIEGLQGLVDIIKIDLMQANWSELPVHLAIYQQHQVQMLAEKIETQAEFEQCKQLGFDYFQGYFLCRPSIVQAKKLSGLKMVMLQLLAELQAPDASFPRIDEMIRQDVTLSYKLLRLINSAFYGTRSEITSIRQALTLLGINQIRAWISLLLLSEADNKPAELLKTAMIRAKMSEALALVVRQEHPETAFTVGLFSVLEALMDMPQADILAQIPLADEIKLALLEYRGDLGNMLQAVVAYEQGHWSDVQYKGLGAETFRSCFFEAVDWADSSLLTLQAAA